MDSKQASIVNAEPYEVYAIRYGHNMNKARDNFLFDPQHLPFTPDHESHSDIHDQMALDYYIWAIIGNGHTVIVDLGFEHQGAKRRGRKIIQLPSSALSMLDIDASSVEDVIVTHLHYDHAGDLASFPNARLHVQESELAYATGPYMAHRSLRLAFDVDYVVAFVRAVYDDRVHFVHGDDEIYPGISVHHIGGHTLGHQAVRVWTNAGWLVLASDAVHLYANIEMQNPFPIVHNVGDVITGYTKLNKLASSPKLVIPGHDPLVVNRFPCPDEKFLGDIVKLSDGPH